MVSRFRLLLGDFVLDMPFSRDNNIDMPSIHQPVKKVSVETPTPKAEKNRMSLISDLKETCLKFEQEVSRLETKPLSGRFTEERRARYLSEARDRLSAARELIHEFTERGINDNAFSPLMACRYYNPASLIGREDLAQRIG